ncbi:MAG: dTDP-4-dehydrorhamnose 3,5-epimerase [Acidobacteriota bacterium]
MIFRETRLSGVFEIDMVPQQDDRGAFARSYCWREFEAHGLNPRVVQCNVSYNRQRGTLRGMHYQTPPAAEAKLIRCARGALYDVVIDLRRDSPTFRQWTAVELRAEAGQPSSMLYVPEGFAHGFLTLEDDTEVFYQMSEFYAPGAAGGFRWNDPAFAVDWPGPVRVISDRDRTYPDFVMDPPQAAAT